MEAWVEETVKRIENDTYLYFKDGLKSLRLGDYKAAAKQFTEAFKENPEDLEAAHYVVLANLKNGKYKRAIQVASFVLKQIDAHNAQAYLARLYIKTLSGNDLTAEANSIIKNVKADTGNPLSYYVLGFAHFEKGDEALAVQYLETAKALESAGVSPIQSELLLALNKGKFYRHFPIEDLLFLDDSQFESNILRLLRLGKKHLARGRFDEAARLLQKVHQLDPHSLEAANLLGYAYLELGEYRKAVEVYEHVTSFIAANNVLAIGASGLVLAMEGGDYYSPMFDLALHYNPDSYLAYSLWGAAELAAGNYKTAYKHLRQSAQLNSDNSFTYVIAGIVRAAQGKYKTALTFLNKGLKVNPKDPRAFYVRGVIYYMTGDYEKALADLKKVKRLGEGFASPFTQQLLSHLNPDGGKNQFALNVLFQEIEENMQPNMGFSAQVGPRFPSVEGDSAAVSFKLGFHWKFWGALGLYGGFHYGDAPEVSGGILFNPRWSDFALTFMLGLGYGFADAEPDQLPLEGFFEYGLGAHYHVNDWLRLDAMLQLKHELANPEFYVVEPMGGVTVTF